MRRACTLVLAVASSFATFASSARGDVIASAERLAQLLIVEHDAQGGASAHTTDVVAIGDALTPRSLERLPRVGLDVTTVGRLTVGAAGSFTRLATAGAGDTTAWLVAPRVGWLARVGGRAAIWPRASVSFGALSGDARTALTLEVPVGFFFTKTTAVTGTPSVDVPLGASGAARFLVSGGILAELGAGMATSSGTGFGKRGAIVVSAERAMPIASYSNETHAATPSGAVRRLTLGPGEAFEPSSQTRADLALDVFLTDHVTLGGTLDFGLVPYEHRDASDAVTTAHGGTLGLSPRVGWATPLGGGAALWLRAGVTWLVGVARYDRLGTPRATELDLGLEALFVYMATPDLGVTLGPSGSLTALADHAGAQAPVDDVGTHLAQLGAAGGLLLAF